MTINVGVKCKGAVFMWRHCSRDAMLPRVLFLSYIDCRRVTGKFLTDRADNHLRTLNH